MYCLRQVRHQISESPSFYRVSCLGIASTWIHIPGDHCLHALEHTCAFASACLSCGAPSRCLGGLSNQQVFWEGNGFWHALATHSCELEYSSSQWPAHKNSARHNDILGLFCDQVITWSPGTILGRFEYRLGIVLGIVLCAPKVACRGLPKLG